VYVRSLLKRRYLQFCTRRCVNARARPSATSAEPSAEIQRHFRPPEAPGA
jgi:hypothetical protein